MSGYNMNLKAAIFATIGIVTIELWILWIPSHLFITSLPHEKQGNSIFIRFSNIFLGILILYYLLSKCIYVI